MNGSEKLQMRMGRGARCRDAEGVGWQERVQVPRHDARAYLRDVEGRTENELFLAFGVRIGYQMVT